MKYYAVVGRIPFDDEDSIHFYETDEEAPPLFEWFSSDIYYESNRNDVKEVARDHGCIHGVYITSVLVSDSPIKFYEGGVS